MSFTWRLEQPDGTEVTAGAPSQPAHANQSDAESWLGENWRELAGADVAQVTLFEGEDKVYGPMPLAEQ
ncbi:hypothetical protein SAMN05443575_2306 [Jatrophihabitans endophyticus]|uniref:Uncharacterized protein n=1 Tax=Jatrophihabitans endophyticus TaxID=1206085 RepID=A0A1M5L075_9ACTN|nr:hypothetical protein [Jatrophihabitans endophyticus]SHG58169.1 hypothetical protein SAMN05443575_2306 [Jatrophihabitans endophyticus]